MTNRRKGKANTASQQSVETGSEHIQTQLQNKAEEAGLVLADNFQAHVLMIAIKQMESGQYGPKTAAIMEALIGGTSAPLEEWGNQIEAWHSPALMPAVSESNG